MNHPFLRTFMQTAAALAFTLTARPWPIFTSPI